MENVVFSFATDQLSQDCRVVAGIGWRRIGIKMKAS